MATHYALEDYLKKRGGREALKPDEALSLAIVFFEETLAAVTDASGEYATAIKSMRDRRDHAAAFVDGVPQQQVGIKTKIFKYLAKRQNGKKLDFGYVDLVLQATEAALRAVEGYAQYQERVGNRLISANGVFAKGRIEEIFGLRKSYAGSLYADLHDQPYKVRQVTVQEIARSLGLTPPSIPAVAGDFALLPATKAQITGPAAPKQPRAYQPDLFSEAPAP